MQRTKELDVDTATADSICGKGFTKANNLVCMSILKLKTKI